MFAGRPAQSVLDVIPHFNLNCVPLISITCGLVVKSFWLVFFICFESLKYSQPELDPQHFIHLTLCVNDCFLQLSF